MRGRDIKNWLGFISGWKFVTFQLQSMFICPNRSQLSLMLMVTVCDMHKLHIIISTGCHVVLVTFRDWDVEHSSHSLMRNYRRTVWTFLSTNNSLRALLFHSAFGVAIQKHWIPVVRSVCCFPRGPSPAWSSAFLITRRHVLQGFGLLINFMWISELCFYFALCYRFWHAYVMLIGHRVKGWSKWWGDMLNICSSRPHSESRWWNNRQSGFAYSDIASVAHKQG